MLKYSRIVIWDSRFFDSVAVRMWISFFGVEIRFLARFRILISLLTQKLQKSNEIVKHHPLTDEFSLSLNAVEGMSG